MAEHNELGKAGEEEASRYLSEHGYFILHRNWKSGKKELDIIARKEKELIIVEVKTRKNADFALPQDAVNNKKIRRIVAAADTYIKKYNIDDSVRFDIITVIGTHVPFVIEHIESAFLPPIW